MSAHNCGNQLASGFVQEFYTSLRLPVPDGGISRQENFCANNELEGFYGDLGSFRCLPELAADVAFTDHLTPILNTGK